MNSCGIAKMLRGKVMFSRRAKSNVEGLLCNYSHRICMQNRLEGYEYCLKHILEDKTAPYKQCNYIYPKNGKRCTNAASKLERKDGCCRIHSHKSCFVKQRSLKKIPKPIETPESLIEELDHYNVVEDHIDLGENITKDLTKAALVRLPLNGPVSRISKIIDYASDSDSDKEPIVVDQTWKGNIDSDAESVDNEQSDPLKYAGVYTAEEVALITKDKLIRLQSLYIEQFKRLQHVIREKRRKYLHVMKQEKEAQGNCLFIPNTHEEVEQYKKLKALYRYHRRHGIERLLHEQSKERRKAMTEGVNYKPTNISKCIYVEKDKKCGQRSLPFSKYCTRHILNDTLQVLFRPCGYEDSCVNPVLPLPSASSCVLHFPLPVFPIYTPPDDTKPSNPQQNDTRSIGDQLDPLTQNSDDMCGLQASDFGAMSAGEMPCSLYGDSGASTGIGDISNLAPATADKELWTGCLTSQESKLREELDSIDLTPGELPPEQLLATN